MLSQLLDQTLNLYQPVRTTDGYRSQVYTWPSTPTLSTVCRLQLISQTVDAPRDGTPRQWQVYAGPELSVATVHDRVSVDGSLFDVVSVYPVHTPLGIHHIEMVVVAFQGEVVT